MLKLILVGLAGGTAVQAWRQWPANGPVTVDAAMLLAAVAVVVAFLAGRSRRGSGAVAVASAVASAEARAESSNRLAVIINNGPGGARPHGVVTPDVAVTPWLEDSTRLELTADQLDGMEVSELLDSHDRDTAN